VCLLLHLEGESKLEKKPSKSKPTTEANKPAGKEYLVPEYYQHTKDSYADLIVDMKSARLPVPSNKSKP